ncbi:hypothetical protein B0T14DRAFT_522215 [Immersiella caudata]|uniref:Uncharacterized protein n=1 Tax=Immersiella caudata TaxID=314043 RepID=A0AA39WSK6_9PEZI|nr:hypothetical protein B0T14DRAFT_522215 [Immersiella caudata]
MTGRAQFPGQWVQAVAFGLLKLVALRSVRFQAISPRFGDRGVGNPAYWLIYYLYNQVASNTSFADNSIYRRSS